MIIRFGYCAPNPGPKSKIKNKWFRLEEIDNAINQYNNESIWISTNGKYHEITYLQLLNIKEKFNNI